MRIGILANSSLALQVIEFLFKQELLVALGVPVLQNEATERIKHFSTCHPVPLRFFSSTDLAGQLAFWMEENRVDLVLVLTFPYRIPLAALAYPRWGFYNFHFGLLPRYRGAEPIFWQIRNREQEGGISIHKVDQGLDTGPVAGILKIPILPQDTYGMHLTKLAYAAVHILQQFLAALQEDRIRLQEQDESQGQYHPRPKMHDLAINWDKEHAGSIRALVNAANPWNRGAITVLQGWVIRVLEVEITERKAGETAPGTIVTADAITGVTVACFGGEVLCLKLLATEEGFFTGERMVQFGLKAGQCFGSVSVPEPVVSR